MRRRLRGDVLSPSTEWCWLHGPRGARVPGSNLDALARALAAEGDGALLVHRGRGYVLQWEDTSLQREDGDTLQGIRRYELTPRYLYRTLRGAGDGRSLPGPFVEQVALPQESRRSDPSGIDAKSMRDAIWWLLSRAEAALEAETTPEAEAEASLQSQTEAKAPKEPFAAIDQLAST